MAPKKIIIVDYGMGNIGSVGNALRRLGYFPVVSRRRQDLAGADAVILPGVGAFGQAMKNIRRMDLLDPLAEAVLERKRPFLGICLGMQLLAEESEELGRHQGLAWIRAKVRLMPAENALRLPHVGWNDVTAQGDQVLYRGLEGRMTFFFDHSYHFDPAEDIETAHFDYGGRFVASFRKGHIMATQFHPEKSQVPGLKLLRNFLNFVESH